MSKKIIILFITIFLLVFVSTIIYKKQVKIDNYNNTSIIEDNNLDSIKHSWWWNID